jgi:6-pyruvoyltetrahydropterin/6-carboxytetrahydropterin synthase
LAAGTVVEFGPLKHAVRNWIDTHLDHGSMLDPGDPLVPLLRANDCKVYEVDGGPTVENVAALLARVTSDVLTGLVRSPGARVSRVHVQETHVNAATWTADGMVSA